jgi:hypothetical protein
VYSTSVYFYIPRQTVVVYSGNSTRRYAIVYAKNLTLNKGVDNKIQFQFLNQEQKPFDITGKSITFRLLDESGSEILLQKGVLPTLALKGICELTTTASEIEDINPQYCSYSLEISDNDYDLPVFVSSEASARGAVSVVDSVFPSFVPAINVEIPTHLLPNTIANTSTVNYSTSIINTKDNPMLSIQCYLDSYSGTVEIYGSTIYSPDLSAIGYQISNNGPYTTESGSKGYSISGYHPYVQLKFTSTEGNVTKVLAR